MNDIRLTALDLLDANPFQPRLSEDAVHVRAIADSIQRDGLLQVPSGRVHVGRVQLAFGMTRLAAFRLLLEETGDEKFAAMPVNIVDLDDESMFEAAITENIRRKALNHIERATAMQEYMLEFDKTSAEVGELFGVNESTVRGTLRLLSLPQSAQDVIRSGLVSIGTARKLLTLQRLAPSKFEEAVATIVEMAHGDNPMARSPESVIKDTIVYTALTMWDKWRDADEPLAGSGLWPLSWTPETVMDFPTKREMKKVWFGTETINGESVLDGVLKRIERSYYEQLDEMLPGIPAQGLALDAMRQAEPAIAPVIDLAAHLVRPPACTTCPHHAKIDGTHYCGLKVCHTRKRNWWTATEMRRASAQMNIPVYDPDVDGKAVIVLEKGYGHNADEALVENRDPDIRLVSKHRSGWANDYTDSAIFALALVGEKAKLRKKAAKEERQRQQQEYESAAPRLSWEQRKQLDALAKTTRDGFVVECAVPALTHLYASIESVGLLEALSRLDGQATSNLSEPEDEATKVEKLAFLRQQCGFNLIMSTIDWNLRRQIETSETPIALLSAHIEGVFRTWGIHPPQGWGETAAARDAQYQHDRGALHASWEEDEENNAAPEEKVIAA